MNFKIKNFLSLFFTLLNESKFLPHDILFWFIHTRFFNFLSLKFVIYIAILNILTKFTLK